MIAAASLVPSLDDAIPYHLCVLPTDVSSVHSSRVRDSPDVSIVTVAELGAAFDDVIFTHCCVVALDVHDSPESVDVRCFHLDNSGELGAAPTTDFIPLWCLP